MDFRDDIPGFKEAVEQERFNRSAAFLGLSESLGGFEVAPLTLRHLLTLRLIESPFVRGVAPADAADIFRFLWIVWPQRTPRVRKQLLRRCRVFTIPWYGRRGQAAALARACDITGQIRQYLMEALADWPPAGKARESYYCDAVAICATFAREYGWSEDTTLDLPLKRLWQYLAEIREFYGKPLFNPSGKLVNDWLLAQQPQDSLLGQLLAQKRN